MDTLGLVHRAAVHAADIQDQEGAKGVLQGMKEANRRLKVVFAESAYKRSKLPDWAKGAGFFIATGLASGAGERFYGLAEALDCGADACVGGTLAQAQ